MSSGQMRHQSSGRRSRRVTEPPVADSMAAQCNGGTLSRVLHMLGALCATPMAEARAVMPPAASKARSMAVMAGLGCNHDRDCAPITNVLQATCQITYVKTIAERLKSAREDLGLSQGELAKRAGVSQSTIANFEAGTRHSPRKLLAIAAALRVDPNWLETGKGSRTLAAGTSLATSCCRCYCHR